MPDNFKFISRDGTAVVRVKVDGACALSSALVKQITDACDRLDSAAAPSMLLLHLSGTSNGTLESAWPGTTTIQLVSKWERALRQVETLRSTTVAIADNACGPVALEVLLTTDYRIAAQNLRLILPSRPRDIWWPGMMIHRLAREIGIAHARKMMLFGGETGAHRAAELGIVNDLVRDSSEAILGLESSPRLDDGNGSIRRRLLLESATLTYEDALGLHLAACDRLLKQRQDSLDSRKVVVDD